MGTIWKSTARLADGREIIYFDESPGLGRPEVIPGPGHREFGLHLQILSVRRAPGKLKYLAGTESGTGAWSNDIKPEEAARQLRGAL